MVTEIIKDKELLKVLQMAIEFENTKGKQKSCFHCGEKFQLQIIKLQSRVKSWQDHIGA